MIEIRGEYEITVLIQNMFHSYCFVEKNHNIVTDGGLNFIMQILARKTTKSLGNIWVGTNTTEPTPLDDVSTFQNATSLQHSSIQTYDNVLVYTITTEGRNITGTSEIGIWSNDESVLITRDVHDTYDVPDSATITLKYSLILSNKVEEEDD